MLAGEYNGEKVRESQHKKVDPKNFWNIVLSEDASGAEPVTPPARYDGA